MNNIDEATRSVLKDLNLDNIKGYRLALRQLTTWVRVNGQVKEGIEEMLKVSKEIGSKVSRKEQHLNSGGTICSFCGKMMKEGSRNHVGTDEYNNEYCRNCAG